MVWPTMPTSTDEYENTMHTKGSRCSSTKIWTMRDLPTFHSQRYFPQALWDKANLHFQRISMNYKADPVGICPRSRIRDIFSKHLKRILPKQKTDFMVNWYPNINNICWRMLGIIITTRITKLTTQQLINQSIKYIQYLQPEYM